MRLAQGLRTGARRCDGPPSGVMYREGSAELRVLRRMFASSLFALNRATRTSASHIPRQARWSRCVSTDTAASVMARTSSTATSAPSLTCAFQAYRSKRRWSSCGSLNPCSALQLSSAEECQLALRVNAELDSLSRSLRSSQTPSWPLSVLRPVIVSGVCPESSPQLQPLPPAAIGETPRLRGRRSPIEYSRARCGLGRRPSNLPLPSGGGGTLLAEGRPVGAPKGWAPWTHST